MADQATATATQLLEAWRSGDEGAETDLIQMFYPWLRQAAAGLLDNERHVSLSTGDLVHEAALRLIKSGAATPHARAHFLALASKTMRRVLIDHMRAKRANKRDHHRVTLITGIEGAGQFDFQALNHALRRLSAIDPAKAGIVEMRYFGGMSIGDIADVTGTSESTVKRQWTAARAWLFDAIENAV